MSETHETPEQSPEGSADQPSSTLRVHVGANTNEAIAANIFTVSVAGLFDGETDEPAK